MTKTEMMKEIERLTKEIERLTAERDEARRIGVAAANDCAEAMRTLKELKSTLGGDAGELLLPIIEREIARCEWERKNVYFVGALKHKIKVLRKIEDFISNIDKEKLK
jgi:hypothetical protein